MSLATPNTVRTLQRTLDVEAKPRIGACFDVTHLGKPCTGKLYARFDEGGLAPGSTTRLVLALRLFHR